MTGRRFMNRVAYPAVMTAASVAALAWCVRARPTHPHMDYLTGWGLLAAVAVLTAYNARKKLSFLPLLTSRSWLRLHSWLGMFAGVLFLMHVGWHVPRSPFDATLAALFIAVTLSGIVGWWLSKVLPKRLTSAGGEVPYERIPVIRRSLREKAEALVVKGIPTAGTSTLADFYAARLSAFFAGPANFGPHLVGSSSALNSMLAELGEAKKYLNNHERSSAIELAALVREKDALDQHRSMQVVLKGWLFVHIPLTYGMLAFIVIHVVVIYAYSGGAR